MGQDKPLLEKETIKESYRTMVMERVANDGQKSPHSNRSDTIGQKEAFAQKKTV